MRDLDPLFAAIDRANATDPNDLGGAPRALVEGERASIWLGRLESDPTFELQLAVRAHHLRRWEIERSDFPTGREGYLRWRRENKAHQANSLADIMANADWPDESVERARTLLGRTKLRTDDDTQSLEDAACLVFLESQFDAMTARLDHAHMVSVVAKTLKKMSPRAVTLAGSLSLSAEANAVLADAVTESQVAHDS